MVATRFSKFLSTADRAAHGLQLLIHLSMSLRIMGHQNRCRVLSSVLCNAMCPPFTLESPVNVTPLVRETKASLSSYPMLVTMACAKRTCSCSSDIILGRYSICKLTLSPSRYAWVILNPQCVPIFSHLIDLGDKQVQVLVGIDPDGLDTSARSEFLSNQNFYCSSRVNN